jgi:hypothetical protein
LYIGTKSLFESLDLTPKAVSKYFNKVRTGHKFDGSELGNAGITIIPEPFSDNQGQNDITAKAISSCWHISLRELLYQETRLNPIKLGQ